MGQGMLRERGWVSSGNRMSKREVLSGVWD
jgi:hypothetical protein